MPNTVYFDLETQRSFSDVGGASHKEKMGMSVGVVYSTETEKYHIFSEEKAEELIKMLMSADLVVGFNHLSFDYAVLQAYTVLNLEENTVNLDMLVEVEKILGHRLKLDSIASASLGVSKTADGLEALRWWQEYKKTGNSEPLMKIAQYCCYDVKVTKAVYEYALEHNKLKYENRSGGIAELELDWKGGFF